MSNTIAIAQTIAAGTLDKLNFARADRLGRAIRHDADAYTAFCRVARRIEIHRDYHEDMDEALAYDKQFRLGESLEALADASGLSAGEAYAITFAYINETNPAF